MKSDLNFLERELSNKLYGIFLKVGKEYRCNFKEEIYLKAIEIELKSTNLKYKTKSEIDVFTADGQKVGICIPDLIVDGKIIIEIKVLRCLMNSSIDQLMKYLEKSRYEIGYLVNFGTSYTQIIRRVYSNNRKIFIQTRADDTITRGHSTDRFRHL